MTTPGPSASRPYCWYCDEGETGHATRDAAHRSVEVISSYAAGAAELDCAEITTALSVISSLLVFPRQGGHA